MQSKMSQHEYVLGKYLGMLLDLLNNHLIGYVSRSASVHLKSI